MTNIEGEKCPTCGARARFNSVKFNEAGKKVIFEMEVPETCSKCFFSWPEVYIKFHCMINNGKDVTAYREAENSKCPIKIRLEQEKNMTPREIVERELKRQKEGL